MKPRRIKEKRRPAPATKPKPKLKDPVEVSCRLRPLEDKAALPCVQAISDNTIELIPPDSSQQVKNGMAKELRYSFKRVFDELTSQKQLFDHIAKPLVNDLIKGKNSLLFTFGITSSGKTHTMTGGPKDGGILPRSLDTLFNTIAEHQARKYVFKPDKMNGFDIQTNSEAMLDIHKDITNHKSARKPKKDSDLDWSQRMADKTKLNIIDSDTAYAVFVSYIELYNNYVYDLLDEDQMDSIKQRNPQSKILREDSNKTMFVHNVTEVEVKSTDEAFEVFCRGQLRRRVAHTALNTESSRSHSVFNIRLVQAPLDPQGGEVLQEKNLLLVSQLSLVDLAGSERTNRTNNVGDRLKEAGNINTSLMCLKNCIEILRENQMNGPLRMVPYRDSKLTLLFKSFFEGVGHIKMIVCVNPRADDYDETIHVMKFAKLTQEVMVERMIVPPPPPANILPAGRGNRYKKAVKQALDEGVDVMELIAPLVYTLGPLLPEYAFEPMESILDIDRLMAHLMDRSNKRQLLQNDLKKKQDVFRNVVQLLEEDNITLRQQLGVSQMDLHAREQQIKNLEKRLFHVEQTRDGLQKRVSEAERAKLILEAELEEKEALVSQGETARNKMKARYKDKIVEDRKRFSELMDMRLKQKEAEIRSKMCITAEKVRLLQEILNRDDDDFQNMDLFPDVNLPEFTPKYNSKPKPSAPPLTPMTPMRAPGLSMSSRTRALQDLKLNLKTVNSPSRANLRTVPVSNPRHRRSFSADGKWVDHRPKGNVDTGTLFQPQMKRKKSVSKLQAKDFTRDSNTVGYALTHQEQDDQGQLETQLFKGNVIPTSGGGAQIVFNDIEKLVQKSPEKNNNGSGKKRTSTEMLSKKDIENRCSYGVEGRSLIKKRRA